MDRESRIKDMISKMTLEEKISQLLYKSPAIERLGIPEYNWWNECLHGVARAGIATVFPQAIAMAATFDDALVKEIAVAISDEARAKHNEGVKQGNRGQYWGLTFWTPNINIFRDPRWGRGQETFGEDPFLTSKIGLAMVQGMQGNDPDNLKISACAKHFAVHSGPEKDRHTFNAIVNQKDLWETYLPAFKVLVDGGVESVMGAYNRTLDEPCCASNRLIKDILRGKWNFKGHFVSDCWAIKDFHERHKITRTPEESAALALNAGCDLNCGSTYPFLSVSYKQGLVTEETINTSLERVLRTRFKLGMFDPPGKGKYGKLGRKVINCDKHRKLALKTAHKSIVLLKNDGNLLPLDSSPKKIVVLGPSAANAHALFGNYYGVSSHFTTIMEGIADKTGDKFGINMDYRQGCLMYCDNSKTLAAYGEANFTDVAIVVMGLDGAMEGEEGDAIASDLNGDRGSIELPAWQLNYLQKVRDAGKRIILVLTGGSAIAFPENLVDAVIFAWYSGESGGKAVADIIFGDVVPSGKLPITFPASTDQLPAYEDYSMKGRTYRYMTEKPLFPFGFGLSYTRFNFDSITLSADSITAGGMVKAVVSVTNTGKMDADEVIQIYITKEGRNEDEPLSSLRGFRRAAIKAGKSVKVEFDLPASAFETIDENGASRLVLGSYTVIAADAAPVPVAVEKGASKPVFVKISVK